MANSKKYTYAEAVETLNTLEGSFPGGERTPLSYRHNGGLETCGIVALTFFRKGSGMRDGQRVPLYDSVDAA